MSLSCRDLQLAHDHTKEQADSLLQRSHDQLIAARTEAYQNQQNAVLLEQKLSEVLATYTALTIMYLPR